MEIMLLPVARYIKRHQRDLEKQSLRLTSGSISNLGGGYGACCSHLTLGCVLYPRARSLSLCSRPELSSIRHNFTKFTERIELQVTVPENLTAVRVSAFVFSPCPVHHPACLAPQNCLSHSGLNPLLRSRSIQDCHNDMIG